MKPLAVAVLTLVLVGVVLAFGPTPETPAPAPLPDHPDVSANEELDIHEWDVPWERTRPRDPYMGPDGVVWFVGQQGDYLARLDPASGEMDRFELPEGAGPHNVIVDDEGYPWYAGNRDAHIGRLDPATGEITRYDTPEGVADPHTLIWTSTGDMWFTAQRSPPAGRIGWFSPETGEFRITDVPGQGMRPYGIVVDSNDRPWIAFMGTNAIGTVDPETMALTMIETPDEESRIRRIGVTSDDRIWWVDAARGWMGVYEPDTEEIRQWKSPGGDDTGLYAMAVDDRDRVWYVETRLQPNRFIGFDTEGEEFFSVTEVPSGGIAVRHMMYDPDTEAIWFGTDAHTIGRARVP